MWRNSWSTITTILIKAQRGKMGLLIIVISVTEYRRVLKHVSTRWLSLEMVIERTLRQYDGLKSYFLSEG